MPPTGTTDGPPAGSGAAPAPADAPGPGSESRALLIGPAACCRELERWLELLPAAQRPIARGWVSPEAAAPSPDVAPACPRLGVLADLERIAGEHRPSLALVCFPAVQGERVKVVRTHLRRLGIADRFVPTARDLLAGVGPRTEIEVDPVELLGRPPRHLDEAAIARLIGGRSVCITGAGGSIGSELARIVARYRPSELVLIERAENALFDVDRQIARAHPALVRRTLLHDIVDVTATLKHFVDLQPQIVFHAAAHKHVPMMEGHPKAAVDNNLLGTKSVADAAHVAGVERFVMISTDKAVNPSSVMGATKRMAELYVQFLNRASRTGFSMVRFGNVLGSAGSVLRTWRDQIADGGPITVTHRDMTRYFMTIPEAASLVIQSAVMVDPDSAAGEVFVLDMGEPVKILELARRLVEWHGLTPVVLEDGRPAPADDAFLMPIVITGARPGEKLHEELATDDQRIRPTGHPDIRVWDLPAPDELTIDRMINRLSNISLHDPPETIAGLIRHLLPEMVDPIAA